MFPQQLLAEFFTVVKSWTSVWLISCSRSWTASLLNDVLLYYRHRSALLDDTNDRFRADESSDYFLVHLMNCFQETRKHIGLCDFVKLSDDVSRLLFAQNIQFTSVWWRAATNHHTWGSSAGNVIYRQTWWFICQLSATRRWLVYSLVIFWWMTPTNKVKQAASCGHMTMLIMLMTQVTNSWQISEVKRITNPTRTWKFTFVI